MNKTNVLSIWLSNEEKKTIEKYRKEAQKDRRSLGSYCKKILFSTNTKKK